METQWRSRHDTGFADLMVKGPDGKWHTVVSVPIGKEKAVLAEMQAFDGIISRHTLFGAIDWGAVRSGFQAHMNGVLGDTGAGPRFTET